MNERLTTVPTILDHTVPHLAAPHLKPPTARHIAGSLAERYQEPWRRHHTVSHLGDVVGFLLENIADLKNPRATLWTAIGHDSIYIPQLEVGNSGLNEELSARVTETPLAGRLPNEPDEEARQVGSHIRASATHKWDGEDTDLAYFLDGDLKILGAVPDEFEAYDEHIREEFWFVEQTIYDAERKRILRGLYDRERLFITDVAHRLFEEQAKTNLENRLIRF